MELRSGSVTGQGILPPEYRPFFEEGARLVFSRWTALNLAIENDWGGPNSKDKAIEIYNECIRWFYASKGELRLMQPPGLRYPSACR